MSEIDNDLYDALGDAWWSPSSPVAPLRQLNPVRAAYFERAYAHLTALPPSESAGQDRPRILDVGCGGGFLSEALARSGYQVSGVDRSASSIQAAERHARAAMLRIDYQVADAAHLPYPDNTFDAVVSSDFLEHVSDRLDAIVAEQARVLKPGGMLGFDTINRTWQSRIVMIWLAQNLLRVLPPRLHTFEMFVPIPDLLLCLARHGIRVREIHGLVPARPPLRFLIGFLSRRDTGAFQLGTNLSISYIGAGRKE